MKIEKALTGELHTHDEAIHIQSKTTQFHCIFALTSIHGGISKTQAYANAQRLAMCWNAFEGVDPEKVDELGGVIFLINHSIEQIESDYHKPGESDKFIACIKDGE